MALIAAPRACPNDNTLVSCSGEDTADVLVGTCPVCKTSIEVTNENPVSAAPAPSGDDHAALTARVDELEQSSAPDGIATKADVDALRQSLNSAVAQIGALGTRVANAEDAVKALANAVAPAAPSDPPAPAPPAAS